jgi:ribulose-phosphate 3-epimerase
MSTTGHLYIAPSLLSADFGNLRAAAVEAQEAGAEYLHFDVMDGHFVPNLTMGPYAVAALRGNSTAVFDVHLMITDPDRYIAAFAEAGADSITVQAETCIHLQRTLAEIRNHGARAGVAINPATPPDVLEYVLGDLDLILVMTVNPGFGGQKFISAVLPKIQRVREMVAAVSHPIEIEVDGGIAPETAGQVVRCGANVLVAGSALYGHPEPISQRIAQLRRAAGEEA